MQFVPSQIYLLILKKSKKMGVKIKKKLGLMVNVLGGS